MSATEGNCVLENGLCVKVDNTKCKLIKSLNNNFTKDYCYKYQTDCTVT